MNVSVAVSMPSKDRVRRKRQKNNYKMKKGSILEKRRLYYEKNESMIKAAQRDAYAANPIPKIEAAKRAYAANPLPKIEAAKRASEKSYAANPLPKIEAAKRASEKSYAANPLPKIEAAKRASEKSYASNPLPKMLASYNNYHKNPMVKRTAAIVRHSKKRLQLCYWRRGRYHLGEPTQLTRDQYLKRIKSRILFKFTLKSKLLCALKKSFSVALKGGNINIANAVANIASSRLLQKVLKARKECVGDFLSTIRSVNALHIPSGFGEACHTAPTEPYFYDQSYAMVRHRSPIPVDREGRCVIAEEIGERDKKTNRPHKWKCTSECKQCTEGEGKCIFGLKSLFEETVQKIKESTQQY